MKYLGDVWNYKELSNYRGILNLLKALIHLLIWILLYYYNVTFKSFNGCEVNGKSYWKYRHLYTYVAALLKEYKSSGCFGYYNYKDFSICKPSLYDQTELIYRQFFTSQWLLLSYLQPSRIGRHDFISPLEYYRKWQKIGGTKVWWIYQ